MTTVSAVVCTPKLVPNAVNLASMACDREGPGIPDSGKTLESLTRPFIENLKLGWFYYLILFLQVFCFEFGRLLSS